MSALQRSNRLTDAQPQAMGVADRLVIFVMFLLPIPPFLGDAAARMADAFRFGSVSGHLFLSPQLSWGRHVRRTSAILLLLFVFACVSMGFGISHTFRDVLDVFRIAAFWTVFLLGASIARRGRSDAGATIEFSRLILLIGVLNAIFSVGQYLLPDFTRPLQALYATGELRLLRMELISEQGRAIGFFGNPNTNAVMLLLLALPSVALYRLTSRPRYLVLGFFVFATVLLTASRTGLVLSAAVLFVFVIASRKLSYIVALAAAAWGSYAVLDFLVHTNIVRDWFPYLSEFLIKVHGAIQGDYFDIESINSFSARLTIWDQTLDWYHMNPLLGGGPLRDVIPSFADNYYVYLLSRYGAIGFSLYVLYTVYVAGLSILAILTRKQPLKEWGTVALASIVVVNIANYTIDAFLIVPIGTVSLLYAGYLVSQMDMSVALLKGPRSLRGVRRHYPRSKNVRCRGASVTDQGFPRNGRLPS